MNREAGYVAFALNRCAEVGLAPVLALGASGAWVGTQFLAPSKTEIHPEYRRRLLAAAESDTFYGTLFDRGSPEATHRALRNSTVGAWERAGRPGSGSRPGEEDKPASRPDGSGVNRYASATPTAEMTGDVEPLSLRGGQGVGLVTREESTATIVTSLVSEAERAIESLRAYG